MIDGKFILQLLKNIGAKEQPAHVKYTFKHLKAQKKQAAYVAKTLIPKLQTIESVLQLYDLIAKKHAVSGNNPYAYIRKERHYSHGAYGNTNTWAEIVGEIKLRLHQLAIKKPTEQLTEKQYEMFYHIMRIHRYHGYGFGWMMDTYSQKQYLDPAKAHFERGEKKDIGSLKIPEQGCLFKNKDDTNIELASLNSNP